jgi:hypothetical protein
MLNFLVEIVWNSSRNWTDKEPFMEQSTDYGIAYLNVQQFPSISWEKLNFFIPTDPTKDYEHSSHSHFDTYHELKDILLLKRGGNSHWLDACPYVRIMPWDELMAWLRQKNKKDSPWLVLSSPAVGETHAVSSTHAMALALAVYWGHAMRWTHGMTSTKK